MNEGLDYYTAPTQEIFDDIKSHCLILWNTYDDTYGYATEKTEYVKSVRNISDNCLTIVAMFDYKNIKKLLDSIQPESREWLTPFVADELAAGAAFELFGIL